MEGHKLHFIGIGGIGMSGIAKIMLNMGYEISGSDLNTSVLTQYLISKGAVIFHGHSAENIPEDTQVIVYSSAVKEDNPELARGREMGIPIYQRAEMLAFLMSKKISIGVAGAHGKTTTSGMMGLMMEKCGLDPDIIIGGTLPQIGSNAKSGQGEYIVAEADESDGTFLLLYPTIAVVTNVEMDHIDHYESMDNIVLAFEQYLRQIPADGLGIIGVDSEATRELIKKVPGNYLTYGMETGDYQLREVFHTIYGVTGEVLEKGQVLGRLHLKVPGKHNLLNALAAVALGRYLGLDFAQISQGLEAFTGTGRRYELLGEVDGIRIIDDYAHHPTEIAATIQATKDLGAARIVAVFQPHRYSRTQALYREFAAALSEADSVIINEIYGAFEKPIPGVTSHIIEKEVRSLGHEAVDYAATLDDTLDLLRRKAKSGDVVLIMGAGNIRSVGQRFVAERMN